MDYKITAILSEQPSKFPDSKKYEFTVEGNTNKLSAFSKFPMAVGQTITGDIVQNGQWYNFKWGKKTPAPAADDSRIMNFLNLRIDRKLDAIYGRLGLLMKAQGIKVDGGKSDYPEMNEENDARGLDKVDTSDTPF